MMNMTVMCQKVLLVYFKGAIVKPAQKTDSALLLTETEVATTLNKYLKQF